MHGLVAVHAILHCIDVHQSNFSLKGYTVKVWCPSCGVKDPLFALPLDPLFVTGATASTAAVSAADDTYGVPILQSACRSLATPSSRLHARSSSHSASAHDAAQPQPATNWALCSESTWQPTSRLCCFPSQPTVCLWCAP